MENIKSGTVRLREQLEEAKEWKKKACCCKPPKLLMAALHMGGPLFSDILTNHNNHKRSNFVKQQLPGLACCC